MEHKSLASVEIAMSMLSNEDQELLKKQSEQFRALMLQHQQRYGGSISSEVEDTLCAKSYELVPGSFDADKRYAQIQQQLEEAGNG